MPIIIGAAIGLVAALVNHHASQGANSTAKAVAARQANVQRQADTTALQVARINQQTALIQRGFGSGTNGIPTTPPQGSGLGTFDWTDPKILGGLALAGIGAFALMRR